MKKLWKILAIGAFAAMLVLPQTAAAGVKFGIKGGANIANVNGDFTETIADWKSSVGFCAGIFLELNFGRILTIQPEVLYTMKGADAGTGKLKFDYIEIPVLLKIRIPMGSVHPFIFAGPAFGFNLKAVLDGIEVEDMPRADYSAVLGGGHDGRCGARAFGIFDHLRLAVFHHRHAGVGGTQVNANNASHDAFLLKEVELI